MSDAKRMIRIRMGYGFGCGYPRISEFEWHPYVWGIDFMGPFTMSRGYQYILVAVDYVSK